MKVVRHSVTRLEAVVEEVRSLGRDGQEVAVEQDGS